MLVVPTIAQTTDQKVHGVAYFTLAHDELIWNCDRLRHHIDQVQHGGRVDRFEQRRITNEFVLHRDIQLQAEAVRQLCEQICLMKALAAAPQVFVVFCGPTGSDNENVRLKNKSWSSICQVTDDFSSQRHWN